MMAEQSSKSISVDSHNKANELSPQRSPLAFYDVAQATFSVQLPHQSQPAIQQQHQQQLHAQSHLDYLQHPHHSLHYLNGHWHSDKEVLDRIVHSLQERTLSVPQQAIRLNKVVDGQTSFNHAATDDDDDDVQMRSFQIPSQPTKQQGSIHHDLNDGGWQSDYDLPVRRNMILEIVHLLQRQRTPNGPSSQEWLDTLPWRARQLEESLYISAESLDEYRDPFTLQQRLLHINNGITDESQETTTTNTTAEATTTASSGAAAVAATSALQWQQHDTQLIITQKPQNETQRHHHHQQSGHHAHHNHHQAGSTEQVLLNHHDLDGGWQKAGSRFARAPRNDTQNHGLT